MNGLTQTQNQFLVLYGFLVLVPHLNRCTLALASADCPFKSLRLHMYLSAYLGFICTDVGICT